MSQLILKRYLVGPNSLPKSFHEVSRLFTSSMRFLQSQEEGTWVHKLTNHQKMFYYGLKAGTKSTIGLSTYNFRKPVEPELFNQAIKKLVKLYSSYRMTIRNKDNEPWVYLLPDMDVDFKVHPKGKPLVDIVRDVGRPFDDEKGPLFRYQLVEAEANDEFYSPEIKMEFPHQYYLYAHMHHSLTDGISHQYSEIYLQYFLDSLIGGKEEKKLPSPGEYLPPSEFSIIYEQTKMDLLKNPSRVDYLKDQMMRMNKPSILFKYFSRPEVEEPTTNHIFINIDQDAVNKFVMRSKENGITFGNAFQAVTNTALVELVQDAGANDDSYDMSMTYTFNTRRFMKKINNPISGNHCLGVSSLITMQKDTRDNFWKNCRMIQNVNKDLIKVDHVFEQEIIRQMFFPSVAPEEFYKSLPKITRDFGFNNIGEMKMNKNYNNVRMTRLRGCYGAHRFIYPFYNHVHSYNGKLEYILSYATDCLSDNTAHLLAQKMKSIVEHHCQG